MEELLDELEKEERFREILNWDTGGLVFLEYLKGVKLIESIRHNGQIDEMFEDLTALSQTLYSRLKLLSTCNPMDRSFDFSCFYCFLKLILSFFLIFSLERLGRQLRS